MKSSAVIDLMSSRRPSVGGLYENAIGTGVAMKFGVIAYSADTPDAEVQHRAARPRSARCP